MKLINVDLKEQFLREFAEPEKKVSPDARNWDNEINSAESAAEIKTIHEEFLSYISEKYNMDLSPCKQSLDELLIKTKNSHNIRFPIIRFLINYNKIHGSLSSMTSQNLDIVIKLLSEGIIGEYTLDGVGIDRLNNIIFKPNFYTSFSNYEEIKYIYQVYGWLSKAENFKTIMTPSIVKNIFLNKTVSEEIKRLFGDKYNLFIEVVFTQKLVSELSTKQNMDETIDKLVNTAIKNYLQFRDIILFGSQKYDGAKGNDAFMPVEFIKNILYYLEKLSRYEKPDEDEDEKNKLEDTELKSVMQKLGLDKLPKKDLETLVISLDSYLKKNKNA